MTHCTDKDTEAQCAGVERCWHPSGWLRSLYSLLLPQSNLLTKNKMEFEHEISYRLIFSEHAGTLPKEGLRQQNMRICVMY